MKPLIPLVLCALCLASCQQSFEDRSAAEAEKYTRKKCPAMISATTRIDSLVFERATHTLHYHYTLTGPADDSTIVAATNPKQLLLDGIRNNTALKDYKEHGYSFAYTYHSESQKGKVLFTATYGPKEYK